MEYERFEKARVIGARALQIKMGAPPLVVVKDDISALDIAKLEFEQDVIPITVIRK
ncbi:MAG: DNA-directed RNA polymerase subunit K [Candidatus Altiarchaeales archaeon]|nr:DNA-directed RNA polymerase subunit K [Candidatus Altiarchaeales archaeon]MBD3415690.1 DNA-directed RNA polymerase subunit K [Candidatus Altiarchaeales archaeon]